MAEPAFPEKRNPMVPRRPRLTRLELKKDGGPFRPLFEART